jgi:hypothetical protein
MDKQLVSCQNELLLSLKRRGELTKDNNLLKIENRELKKEIQKLEEQLEEYRLSPTFSNISSDTLQSGSRTTSDFSDLSYFSDAPSSFDSASLQPWSRTTSDDSDFSVSDFSDTPQKGEIEYVNINLEVTFSLKNSTDFKKKIDLTVTNKDNINTIKQGIIEKLNIENLTVEKIIVIDTSSGRVIDEDYPTLFDLFKNNENINVIVIDKKFGGSYKKKQPKKKKTKKKKTKNKSNRR